jgi:hypothetical protein
MSGMADRQKTSEYRHPEAFCLMTYCEVTGEKDEINETCEKEVLWNTRDGVTPFFIGNKAETRSMKHIDWSGDVRKKDHIPQPGDRVFMDLSKEDYIAYTKLKVDKMWDEGEFKMSDHFESKEQAIESLSSSWQEGMPCVRVVAKEGWPNVEPEVWD